MARMIWVLALVTALLTSCGSPQSKGREASSPGHSEPPATVADAGKTSAKPESKPAETTASDLPPQSKPMIIKTGKVEIKSLDFLGDLAKVRTWVLDRENQGAYLSGSELRQEADTRYADLVIKVPAAEFDELDQFLFDGFSVTARESSSEDVSEEYVDLAARLQNARTQEQRLQRLLVEKTNDLNEILKMDGEITKVREKIEIMAGRQRALETRVALATLTVRLREIKPPAPVAVAAAATAPAPPASFAATVANAFLSSSQLLISMLQKCIVALSYSAPFLIFAAAIFFTVFIAIHLLQRFRPSVNKPVAGRATP